MVTCFSKIKHPQHPILFIGLFLLSSIFNLPKVEAKFVLQNLLAETSLVTSKPKPATATAASQYYDRNIDGIIHIIDPSFRKKNVPNNTHSAKLFISTYDKQGNFILLSKKPKPHKKNKKKKSKFIGEIIVWEKGTTIRLLNPNDVVSSLETVNKYFNPNELEQFYSDCIKMAQSPHIFLKIIPYIHNEQIQKEGYLRYFNHFNSVKAIYDGMLEWRVLNDTIRTIAATQATRRIKSKKDFSEYMKLFKGIADDVAFTQLIKVIPCSEAIALVEEKAGAGIYWNDNGSIEQAYCFCSEDEVSFDQYRKRFPNGQCLEQAFNGLVNQAMKNCNVFSLLLKYPDLAQNYKKSTFDQVLNCVNSIESCNELNNIYSSDADIVNVLNRAKNYLSQEEMVTLLEIPRYRKQRGGLEKDFSDAIEDLQSYELYRTIYKTEGSFYTSATQRIIDIASDNCELVDLCQSFPGVAQEFKQFILPKAIQCIKKAKECLPLTEIYAEQEDIILALQRVITVAEDKNDFVSILHTPRFSFAKETLMPFFAENITFVEDVPVFFTLFTEADSVINQKVLIKGMQLAEEKEDYEALAKLVIQYMRDIGPLEEVSEYLGCGATYHIIQKHEEYREELHEKALRCIEDNIDRLNIYVKTYNNPENGLDVIIPQLGAEGLRDLYQNYSGNCHNKIGEVYPYKIRSLEDARWYITKYNQSPELKEVYKTAMGFAFQESQMKSLQALLSDYFRKFEFDLNLANEYLADCEFLHQFLEINIDTRAYLRNLSLRCAQDLKYKDQHLIYFPNDWAILNAKEAIVLYKAAIKTLSTTVSTQKLEWKSDSVQQIRFAVKKDDLVAFTFENIPSTNILVSVFNEFGEEIKPQSELSREQPTIFIEKEEIKGDSVVFTFQPIKRKHKTITIRNYHLPKVLEKGRVASFFNNLNVRENLLIKIDKLATNKNELDYVKEVLGTDFFNSLSLNQNITNDQRLELARKVALRFNEILKVYPTSWWGTTKRRISWFNLWES